MLRNKSGKSLAWLNDSRHRCQEIVKETRHSITRCGLESSPRFTRPLKDIDEYGPQPEWYCPQHERHHPQVSVFSKGGITTSRTTKKRKEVSDVGRTDDETSLGSVSPQDVYNRAFDALQADPVSSSVA